jgi:biotin carboxyl carrier protein
MPGRVVRVLAHGGDAIEKGVPIIIVEAMKMENELPAPRRGVIEAVHVAEGDTVAVGQALLDVAEAE